MGKVCAFFGHREPFNLGNQKEWIDRLKTIVSVLIEKEGVDTFYVGGHGAFDVIAGTVVRDLKEKYPFIRTWLILAYGSQLMQYKPLPPYDTFDYPISVERCKRRYAIVARNQYMVNCADFIVSYVDGIGGAYCAVRYALKKHKTVINLTNFNFADWE